MRCGQQEYVREKELFVLILQLINDFGQDVNITLWKVLFKVASGECDY